MRISWKWRVLTVAAVGIVYFSLAALRKDSLTQINNLSEQGPQRTPAAVNVVNEPVKEVQVADEVPAEKVQALSVSQLPQPEVIQKFKVIQAKVFKSKEDQATLKKMLSDSGYLLQLGLYLKTLQNVEGEDFKANQNAVMDLLVEALKSGDAVAAEQAILDIVKDPQVEDEKIAFKSRELLAEIKAELLYQSTSIKPGLSDQFERILPGPVSQKIWKNVQQQQSDNLALSSDEIQNRVAQKNK